MSRHKHKARGKVTQKLTRDGLVERNAATGEEERLSGRSADFDIRGARADDHALSQSGTRTAEGSQSAKHRNRATYKQTQTQNTQTTDVAEAGRDAPLQFTTAESVKSEPLITAETLDKSVDNDTPRQDEAAPLRQEHVQRQLPPSVKSKPPPGKRQEYYQQYNQPQLETPAAPPTKLNTERGSKLQTDGDSALQFSRDDTPPPQGTTKRPKPQHGKDGQPVTESTQAPSTVSAAPVNETDAPQSALRFDKPDKLHFTEDTADSTVLPVKPKQQRYAPSESEQSQQAIDAPSDDTVPVTPKPPEQQAADNASANGADSSETAQAPLKEPETALKPTRESKLRFKPEDTPPETAKPNRKLAKAQKQADKSVEKLEAAKSELPARKKLRSKTVVNEETGKPKRKLYFESEVKPMGEHIKGAKPLRPVKAAANSALMFGHTKMFQVEHENVGIKAAHRAEMLGEAGVRIALRRHKTAPYRKVEKLQRQATKKSINLTYQKTLAENPKLKGNPLSKAFQKRKIKRDYAKKVREAQKAAQQAKKAGTATAKTGRAIVGVIKRHPVASAVVILVILLIFMLMSLIGTFGSLGSGGIGAIAAGTYLAEDADILGAQAAYAGMEADLQNTLDNYAALNPGFDEYVYDLDSIWHDPYVLIAILSAFHDGAWTLDEVQGTLAFLFERQYILTETASEETRYADPTDADGDGNYEPYQWRTRMVTLDNFNLSHLPIHIMGETGLSRYALYMMTLGNRPDLFPVGSFPNASYYRDYGRHDVPQAYKDADPIFAAIITEAEKWLGMPYVWGGYSPVTSFDCSGYVSWVYNQSGWDFGRLGAQGLYNISTPVSASDAKPGDLVFFVGTYDTPGVSHVGIYVGDGMFVHAGNPIGYADITTAYWQSHFYAYGKLY